MITTYLLQNCKHCKDLLKYIKKNPNVNICLIMVSNNDIKLINENEPRIKQFPVAFTGNPKKNGLPYKNSHVISGSSTILETLKNNFGNSTNSNQNSHRNYKKDTLRGSNIDIDYLNNNEGNISSLTNIRKHRNNCFGNSCHVMDRPFGPTDNQYILQGYQPPCALPIRSDLPIRKSESNEMNYFGMTTPGTKNWQLERQPRPKPRILIDDRNTEQYLNGNQMVAMNTPRTFNDDYLNRKIWNPLNLNNFGTKGTKGTKRNSYLNKFISGPVNQTAPFLTYAAGGNGVSRVTGKNYLREQVPIERSPKTAYISGNIKNYVSKNLDNQRLLAGGLDSPWSINAQGINNYGNSSKKQIKLINKVPRPSVPSVPSGSKKTNKPFGNENPWVLTRSVSGNGTNQTQYFKRQRFPNNGNGFGKKETLKQKKKEMKFTSPLGIEISFN